ncbi:50S ribosomal protein L32e [Metallosphaera sp. J1]|uniref:50S ribosomal protein L32e n=1 Tax=Metallosphaera TaxID=41980 RepID=UPI001EDF6271|nr:50S ribosomal protein L32e [Metallosphaera javensis (ex Hofmann et al. 2022)]MCG3107759.1 50S ribosomal protein L32e [Metallosphaera javensis (ex Hofmann et al. 2022)]BCS92090.1 MAG: 50S ribosomal protein L32e [Metallosphaera javensis (ex Sakai et al. 2022)]
MKTEMKLNKKKIYKMKLKHKALLPKFLRYDWDKYFRLERQERWRRTRGQDNKTRLRIKGFPKPVMVGFRSPKVIRYLHPSGLREVIVNNVNEVESLKDSKDKIILRISGKVGLKKRLEIINKAKEMGFRIANGE